MRWVNIVTGKSNKVFIQSVEKLKAMEEYCPTNFHNFMHKKKIERFLLNDEYQ